LVRQVLGAISEFDKAMTVAKLRGARERKRREAGKCEGRKSHAQRNPELVALSVNCAGVALRAGSGRCEKFQPSLPSVTSSINAALSSRRPRSSR
jgi:hypothetical protein